jgi:hypothetical protein
MGIFACVLRAGAIRWPGWIAFLFFGVSRLAFAQELPPEAPPPQMMPQPGQPPAWGYPPPPSAPTDQQATTVAAHPIAPADTEDDWTKRFSVGATLGAAAVSETNATSVLLAPILDASATFHRMFALRATWGFAWEIDGQGSTLRSGNPMLAGVFRMDDRRWRLRAELGVTAPAAHVPLGEDGRTVAFTYNQTMAMWGMWNQWLWETDHMAVPVSATFAYAFDEHWIVVDAAEATLVGVRGGASGTHIVGQIGLEARLTIDSRLTLCPRWQTVRLPSGDLDGWQSAVGLRVRLETSKGTYFAGMLLNLDEPLGILGGLQRWGIQLGKEIDL